MTVDPSWVSTLTVRPFSFWTFTRKLAFAVADVVRGSTIANTVLPVRTPALINVTASVSSSPPNFSLIHRYIDVTIKKMHTEVVKG